MILVRYLKYIIIGLIKIYQMIPLSSHGMCRYIPTCSGYMIEAIRKYGTLKGLKLGIKRILRCNRHGSFGYDPVK